MKTTIDAAIRVAMKVAKRLRRKMLMAGPVADARVNMMAQNRLR